jgi:hypothetical protein
VGATVTRRRTGLAEVTPGPLAAAVERWCLEALRPPRDPQWQRSWWEQYLGRELTRRDYALVAGRSS